MLAALSWKFVGGWIASIAVSVGKFIVKWLCALCADISDAFKDPMRFVVRITFGIAILLLGWHLGADTMREDRDIWRDAHAKIIEDTRKADAKNKLDLSAALKAKADAEAALLVRKVKTLPVAPPPAPTKRVQQPKRTTSGAG